jgi:protein-S-isoprenylcysteine O-methyltransferase Ste14
VKFTTGSYRVDAGRLVMVPAAAGFAAYDVLALARGPGGMSWLTAAPVCAFYALMIWCYLRRGRAVATSRSVTAHVAAVAAMLLPFVFPLLTAAPAGAVQRWAGDLLVAAGTGWALWALWALGRNVSVLAQARSLVVRGPYRWVRHPLYTGEIVSSLGLAVIVWNPAAAALWAAFCGLQAYRALREEQLLVRVLPGYRDYRARTAVLFPWIF